MLKIYTLLQYIYNNIVIQFCPGFIGGEDGKEGRWIGLGDYGNERLFKWSDGTPISFVNWNDGEPNGYYDDEDCVALIPSLGNKWNDERCNLLKKSVCEKRGKYKIYRTHYIFNIFLNLWNRFTVDLHQS